MSVGASALTVPTGPPQLTWQAVPRQPMRPTTFAIIALCLLPSCASNDDSLAYLNQAQVEMMAQIDRARVMAMAARFDAIAESIGALSLERLRTEIAPLLRAQAAELRNGLASLPAGGAPAKSGK